jgi:predicted DNA-binding transcriptional regulator AlpA
MSARTNSAQRQPAADLHGIVAALADLIAGRVAENLREALKAREHEPSASAKAPDYLSESALSKRTGISRRTLQTWRARGRPPRWVKLGNRVLYDARALDELLKGRGLGGTTIP